MPRAARSAAKRTPAKKAVASSRRGTATAAKKASPQKATKKAVPARKARAAKAAPVRRAARAETTRAAPARRAKKGGPLDKFLLEQRALLQAERATYIRQAETLKAEADQLAEEMEPGDIQFDEESGEGDTLNVERERDLALSAQARAAVDEIDRALAKMDAGTYGVCERCGNPIPKARLKALPYASLCVACKSGGLSRR